MARLVNPESIYACVIFIFSLDCWSCPSIPSLIGWKPVQCAVHFVILWALQRFCLQDAIFLLMYSSTTQKHHLPVYPPRTLSTVQCPPSLAPCKLAKLPRPLASQPSRLTSQTAPHLLYSRHPRNLKAPEKPWKPQKTSFWSATHGHRPNSPLETCSIWFPSPS